MIGFTAPLWLFLRDVSICDITRWLACYRMAMVVIFPSCVSLIANGIIFNLVHSSSRRILPHREISSTSIINLRRRKLSHRDIYLLKHMIFMLVVYIGGWGPIYIVAVLNNQPYSSSTTQNLLFVLAEISTLCNIADLFLYHRAVRRYLLNKVQQFF
ncbi:unnamed protein product [Rotaria magnacalcarata]